MHFDLVEPMLQLASGACSALRDASEERAYLAHGLAVGVGGN